MLLSDEEIESLESNLTEDATPVSADGTKGEETPKIETPPPEEFDFNKDPTDD